MLKLISRVFEYLKVIGIRGLLLLFLSYLTKKTYIFKFKYNNLNVSLRVPSSDVWVYKQIFLDMEYFFTTVKEPKIILDAGANIGLASIYFSSKYPNAKVIALEPEKKNFELLLENVKSYPNIIPVNAALWSCNSDINLCDVGQGDWGYVTYDSLIEKVDIIHKVKALTVDDIINNFNLNKIDILKMDIEGAEKEIFNNDCRWINKVDSLIVELHDRIEPGCSRVFYNNTNGFKTEWVRGENIYLTKGCIAE